MPEWQPSKFMAMKKFSNTFVSLSIKWLLLNMWNIARTIKRERKRKRVKNQANAKMTDTKNRRS